MGLLFSYEVIPNDYARIRAFLKDYKHLQGIRFYLKIESFLEVKNQMKEGKDELQLIKKKYRVCSNVLVIFIQVLLKI